MKHAREDYNRIQDPAGKIPENEPVFLLRGQDVLAAETLDFYARRCAESGVDLRIVELTRNQAQKMREWPLRKLPDLTNAREPAEQQVQDNEQDRTGVLRADQ